MTKLALWACAVLMSTACLFKHLHGEQVPYVSEYLDQVPYLNTLKRNPHQTAAGLAQELVPQQDAAAHADNAIAKSE